MQVKHTTELSVIESKILFAIKRATKQVIGPNQSKNLSGCNETDNIITHN
jgi:hypothetical protein